MSKQARARLEEREEALVTTLGQMQEQQAWAITHGYPVLAEGLQAGIAHLNRVLGEVQRLLGFFE